mmetsp:Transcript_40084/g.102574  ORF Transcript_40084/g.102574 Transcript_40084/m.102574 type:complete len:482 (+) Transcript_40084:573-2018(+)|eukprot:jgi/Tetstr1/436769/TSEL_025549.t1
MQNIGASNQGDAFYRYKMPRLQTKIEGRGNGIKTNVMNNVEVAKALERPPAYLIKYYGCELGAQTKYDDKTGTSIVNGAHQTATIADLLEGFIKKYVQCYSCGNPETVVNIDKKDFIFLKCKACGAVSDVDMRHKLNTFILKNPPEAKVSKAEKKIRNKMAEATGVDIDDDASERKKEKKAKKEKKEKKEKKDKKDRKDKKKTGSGSEEEDDLDPSMRSELAGAPDVEDEEDEEEETEWMTDTSAAAVAARVQAQLTGATASMVTVGNLEEEIAAKKKADKEARKAEKAARKAAKEAAKKMNDLSVNGSSGSGSEGNGDGDDDDDDDDIDVPALREYILSRSAEDAATALAKMEVPGGPVGTARLMWDVIFGGDEEPLSGKIADKAEYIKAHLSDANSQLIMLGGLEHYVTVAAPEQIKELPKVLKVLYDDDLCEEEVILAWNKRTAIAEPAGVTEKQAEAARLVATPIIKWLEEADEDSD